MKCPGCKAEFTPPPGKSVANCPFCAEPLLKPATDKKCETLAEALASIKSGYGADILLNSERLVAFLCDLLPKRKVERNILAHAFNQGIPAKLAAAKGGSPQEQGIILNRCVQTLKDSYGTDKTEAENVLWVFAEALGWQGRPEPQAAPTPAPAPAPASASSAPQVGSLIPFAGYDWRVLAVKDGKALLISEKVFEHRAYNDEKEDVTWETCTLRSYLNKDFYGSLPAEARARISETQVVNNDNPVLGASGGADTLDKIFLLSIDEAEEYFNSDEARVAHDSGGECSFWWLRSPGFGSHDAASVFHDGYLNVNGSIVHDDIGLRPALWLNL